MKTHRIGLALALLAAAGGAAAQAVITHEMALAGNVTPGDAPGYPVHINVPGHFVLKSNLQVPADAGGIVISSSNVTLDLNGFAVVGPGTCTHGSTQVVCSLAALPSFTERAAMAGIHSGASRHNVTVRNGTVTGMRGFGLVGEGMLVQNLAITANRHSGIWVGGHIRPSILSMLRVQRNGGHGIEGSDLILERSTVVANGGHGVTGNYAQVIDSRIGRNVQRGITASGTGSLIRGVDLRDNGQGPTWGKVVSQGGNYNGDAVF